MLSLDEILEKVNGKLQSLDMIMYYAEHTNSSAYTVVVEELSTSKLITYIMSVSMDELKGKVMSFSNNLLMQRIFDDASSFGVFECVHSKMSLATFERMLNVEYCNWVDLNSMDDDEEDGVSDEQLAVFDEVLSNSIVMYSYFRKEEEVSDD